MAIKVKKKKTGRLNPLEAYIALRNYIESRSTPAGPDDIAALIEERKLAKEYADAYGERLPAESPLEVRATRPATKTGRV